MTATKPGFVVANGDAIRRNRNASCLSRESLSLLTESTASVSTVSVSTIRRAEASKRVDLNAIRAIATVLKVDASRLIKRNEACEIEIREIWENIIKVLSQRPNRSISIVDLLHIFPDDEFDTMRELHSLLFFGVVDWDEEVSPFIENLDISLSDGWTNRFTSENFADPEPTKTEVETFLQDFIKFYTRTVTSFAAEHEDQLGLLNLMRKRGWEKGDLANAGPHLRFPEIVTFFEARGLSYSKIIGCLRELAKQNDILCDEDLYYAKPSELLIGGTRTRIRKSAWFLPSPKHTARIPELTRLLYHR